MESPDPEELMEVVAIIAGAGTTGVVTGFAKSVVPQVAPELAGAGIGLVLYLFGGRYHPLLKAYGIGLLAGSLAPMISGAIPKLGVAPAKAPAKTTAAATSARAYAKVR